jgi:hypothetical protein
VERTVPVKGLKRTQLIVLGAIIVYHLVPLHQVERQLPLGRGTKALLRVAWSFLTTPQLNRDIICAVS